MTKKSASPTPITLSNLKPRLGSRRRPVRLGMGEGSTTGQTSTKGSKGQRARSGDGKMWGFEGGQNPIIRRVPKRGFTNGMFKVVYQVVSLETIAGAFKNQKEVTLEAMRLHGLIKGRALVKILGDGDFKAAYKISAHAFSKSARKKIEAAGGQVELAPR